MDESTNCPGKGKMDKEVIIEEILREGKDDGKKQSSWGGGRKIWTENKNKDRVSKHDNTSRERSNKDNQ